MIDSQDAPARPARRDRFAIFVEGTLDLRPATEATLERFVHDFLTVEAPLLERTGVEVIGAWRSLDQPAPRLVHVYRFDDLAAMQAAGQGMAHDPQAAELAHLYDWVEDPEFSYTRLMGGSMPFLDLRRIDEWTPGESGRWLQVRQRVRFAGPGQALPVLKSQYEAWRESGALDVVVAFDTIHGAHGDVVCFGIPGPDVDSIDDLRSRTPQSVRQQLDGLLTHESVQRLAPMPYSRLC
jgi:hypothetical protein